MDLSTNQKATAIILMTDPLSLIDAIRQSPSMYLGSKSLTSFYHFYNGYQLACDHHQIKNPNLDFAIVSDFDDWVAYRTHFTESTSGWCNMILATTLSEEDAFDRFFTLRDEHSIREPQLVAEIIGPVSNKHTMQDGKWRLIPPPAKIQIVTYTDDPGFFALHDCRDWKDEFYPYLTCMQGVVGGDLVIRDAVAYRKILERTKIT